MPEITNPETIRKEQNRDTNIVRCRELINELCIRLAAYDVLWIQAQELKRLVLQKEKEVLNA